MPTTIMDTRGEYCLLHVHWNVVRMTVNIYIPLRIILIILYLNISIIFAWAREVKTAYCLSPTNSIWSYSNDQLLTLNRLKGNLKAYNFFQRVCPSWKRCTTTSSNGNLVSSYRIVKTEIYFSTLSINISFCNFSTWIPIWRFV